MNKKARRYYAEEVHGSHTGCTLEVGQQTEGGRTALLRVLGNRCLQSGGRGIAHASATGMEVGDAIAAVYGFDGSLRPEANHAVMAYGVLQPNTADPHFFEGLSPVLAPEAAADDIPTGVAQMLGDLPLAREVVVAQYDHAEVAPLAR